MSRLITILGLALIFIGCEISPQEIRSGIDECTKLELGHAIRYNGLDMSVTSVDCCTKSNYSFKCDLSKVEMEND